MGRQRYVGLGSLGCYPAQGVMRTATSRPGLTEGSPSILGEERVHIPRPRQTGFRFRADERRRGEPTGAMIVAAQTRLSAGAE
jgi:hypothetical protein